MKLCARAYVYVLINKNLLPGRFRVGLISKSACGFPRYGLSLSEVRDVAARAMHEEKIDYLDLAVWDYRKEVQEPPFEGTYAGERVYGIAVLVCSCWRFRTCYECASGC